MAICGLERSKALFDLMELGLKPSIKGPGNCLAITSSASWKTRAGRFGLAQMAVLVCYQDGRFQSIGTQAGLADTFVYGIAQDQGGAIWITANFKLYRYDRNSFACFDPLKQQENLGGVTDVTVDQNDAVWVLLKGGVVCRFRANHFEPAREFAAMKGQALRYLSTDSEGAVWVSNFGGGAYRYQNGQVKAFSQNEGLLNAPVRSRVVRDRHGAVWMGINQGVVRIFGETCTLFRSNGKDTLGEVSAIYEDKEGNLWIGSSAGLNRFTDGSFTQFGPEEGLPEGKVKALCEDSDRNLWLATSDGIYKAGDRFTRVLSATECLGGESQWIELVADPRDHSLWIGTMHGLVHYYHQTQTLTQYTTNDGLPNDGVRSLCLSHQGILWIGCETGLVCLKEGKFATPEVCQRATRNLQVTSLVEDHAGGIWIGTLLGPFLYKNDAIVQFGRKDGLASVACSGMYVGSEGTVWLLTWNGGLSRYTGVYILAKERIIGRPDIRNDR
jgi:ligand-binding sensor domain-containing protein